MYQRGIKFKVSGVAAPTNAMAGMPCEVRPLPSFAAFIVVATLRGFLSKPPAYNLACMREARRGGGLLNGRLQGWRAGGSHIAAVLAAFHQSCT